MMPIWKETMMGVLLANPQHLVGSALASALEPPPPLDLHRWACDNIVFGKDSPYPGPYDPARFPWNEEILRALSPDDPTRLVALKGSAQFGKTVIALIFCAGSVAEAGGYFLYVHPQEDNAARWAKMKLRPMLRQSSCLTKVFGRVEENSLSYIERRDGLGAIQVSGARSEASLSMVSAERQVQDDLAKWEDNNAGDPEAQADSRSASFRRRKVFKASTPLIMPGCRITVAYDGGTQEQVHMPCPHCGHAHPLTWANMQETSENRDPADAGFSCPECGGLIQQHHLREMRRQAHWVAGIPAAPYRSFYIWRAYIGVDTFADIWRAWLKAKGDPKAEQVFFNDWLGLAYEVAGSAPPAEALIERAEHGHRRGVVPHGFPMLTAGIDVQGGESNPRCEAQIVAWAGDLRRAVVDYIVVRGSITDTETRAELTRLIGRKWLTESGSAMGLDLTAIDANAYTADVMDWVKTQPSSKLIAVRGANSELAPPIALVKYEKNKRGQNKRFQRRFYNVGVSGMKAALYRNLTKDDPLARGYIALPNGMEAEYFEQLTAETRVRLNKADKRGRIAQERWAWMLKRDARNEALDNMNYAEAAAVRLGWRDKQRDDAWWDERIAERFASPAGQLDLEDWTAPAAAGSGTAGGDVANGVRGAAGEKASGPRAAGKSLAARLKQPGD
jgi:phage terminase large subunit GpA-like protein